MNNGMERCSIKLFKGETLKMNENYLNPTQVQMENLKKQLNFVREQRDRFLDELTDLMTDNEIIKISLKEMLDTELHGSNCSKIVERPSRPCDCWKNKVNKILGI